MYIHYDLLFYELYRRSGICHRMFSERYLLDESRFRLLSTVLRGEKTDKKFFLLALVITYATQVLLGALRAGNSISPILRG